MGYHPDDLGARDPAFIAKVQPLARWLGRTYLRLEVDGLENVRTGPTIYAANHNGGISGPDMMCTLSTLWSALGPEAPLYALAHDFVMRQLTPIGRVICKLGAVNATRANAERILASGGSFLVYPGGDIEAFRHGGRRDEIVLGNRKGFVRTAQRTGAPIVPVVAHGAHRSGYVFHEGKELARVLGLKKWARVERFPLALALPWGIAASPWLPYFPLPFAIRLRILPAEHVAKDDDPAIALERIRTRMQAALDDLARAAESERKA